MRLIPPAAVASQLINIHYITVTLWVWLNVEKISSKIIIAQLFADMHD